MKPFVLFFLALCISPLPGIAQVKDAEKTRETVRQLLREGDFNNAVMVLQRGLSANPNHPGLLQDLTYSQYLKKDYAGAAASAQLLLQQPGAEVEAFQIAALVYRALESEKECERVYKSGLRKFPRSGVLCYEYGEFLFAKKIYGAALTLWEQGIESAPNVPGNYYQAARYYLATPQPFWGLIYGEIFINLESFTERTQEIKALLLRGYQQYFSTQNLLTKEQRDNPFARACAEVYQPHLSLVDGGITPETLAVLQKQFILDWDARYATQFPFRLFDHYRQLQQLGLFEAYLQWVYGAVANPAAYEAWNTAHERESNEFRRLQQNRVFKIPSGQYYHARH